VTAAERQKAYRRRRDAGVLVLPIAITPTILEALLLAARLDDRRSEDRDEITTEIAALLEDWSRTWLKPSDA